MFMNTPMGLVNHILNFYHKFCYYYATYGPNYILVINSHHLTLSGPLNVFMNTPLGLVNPFLNYDHKYCYYYATYGPNYILAINSHPLTLSGPLNVYEYPHGAS